jgi:hypothetical protein
MKTPHRSGALASRRGKPLSYGCEARNWVALYPSSIKACKSIGFRFAARRAIVCVPGTWQPVRKATRFFSVNESPLTHKPGAMRSDYRPHPNGQTAFDLNAWLTLRASDKQRVVTSGACQPTAMKVKAAACAMDK